MNGVNTIAAKHKNDPYAEDEEHGKYWRSLQSLKPIRFGKKDLPAPVDNTNFFQFMTFAWLTKTVYQARKSLTKEQVPPLSMYDEAQYAGKRLRRIYAEEKKKKGIGAIKRAFLKYIQTRMIMSTIVIALTVFSAFLGPAVLVNLLVKYVDDGNKTGTSSLGYGMALACGLLCTEFGRSLLFSLFWAINYRTAVRARGAVLTLIYEKISKLRSLKDKSVGELVNLVASDGQRVAEMIMYGGILVGAPVMLLFATVYCYMLIGWTSLIGIVTFLSFIPYQFLLSKLMTKYRRQCIMITDTRVRMMNEVLTCVKLIKMYAWELSFAKSIARIRSSERKILQKQAAIQSIQISFIPIVPVISTVLTFLVHTLLGYHLDAIEAFTVIAIFNAMRFILAVLPLAVKAVAEVFVSFDRMDSIMLMEEMQEYSIEPRDRRNVIELNDLTVAWDVAEKSTAGNADEGGQRIKKYQKTKEYEEKSVEVMWDINLKVKKGSLIGICGTVGAGKSTLVSSILGQTRFSKGSVGLKGSLAYVPQQAWIFHASVRENITFGLPFIQEKYDKVVAACCLKMDFDILTDGDQTEVGERGINLSGGQRQRISLARAVYSENDIIILDDPLSAVDAHVGKHIFFECIKDLLLGKTVIFVTHQLQYLKDCDIVILLKEGRIHEMGKHDNLMRDGKEYSQLITNFYLDQNDDDEDEEVLDAEMVKKIMKQRTTSEGSTIRDDKFDAISIGSKDEGVVQKNKQMERMGSMRKNVDSLQVEGGSVPHDLDPPEFEENDQKGIHQTLVSAETTSQGSVSGKTYNTYVKAAGGWFAAIGTLLLFTLLIFGTTLENWWLSYWINQGGAVTNNCSAYLTTPEPQLGSTVVPIYEPTIPDGVYCQNVTSDDISTGEELLFYQSVYFVILLITLLIVGFKAWAYAHVTIGASSHLHDEVFKVVFASPMSFFDTTPTGRILNRFSKDMDDQDVRLPQTMETFLIQAFLVFFSILTMVLVFPYFLIIIIIISILFVYLYQIFRVAVRELKRMDNTTRSPMFSHVTSTVQGLSTIHAYKKTDEFIETFNTYMDANSSPYLCYYSSMRWLAVRLDAMTISITFMIAVFVVLCTVYPDELSPVTPSSAGLALSYAVQMTGLFQVCVRFSVETESYFTAVERIVEYIHTCPSEAPKKIKGSTPAKTWPAQGQIEFRSTTMRYRPGLPLVLRGIRCVVKPNEKVGIVGRTGSGKSSIGIVLFRLVELCHGSIVIDGVDIAKIGLEDLRKKLSIIPQDPVLFVGTVRYNLDPFDQYSDSEIWVALQRTHMKEPISSLPDKLMTEVVENGENFSVGERQLLCMARAILRHSRIIMLDEATAAIDSETDALVQETIRDAFSDCTMLTIAHRLNTVLTSDRILVMDNGYVAEFDTPANLLTNSNSQFAQMVAAAASIKDEEKKAKGEVPSHVKVKKDPRPDLVKGGIVNMAFEHDESKTIQSTAL